VGNAPHILVPAADLADLRMQSWLPLPSQLLLPLPPLPLPPLTVQTHDVSTYEASTHEASTWRLNMAPEHGARRLDMARLTLGLRVHANDRAARALRC